MRYQPSLVVTAPASTWGNQHHAGAELEPVSGAAYPSTLYTALSSFLFKKVLLGERNVSMPTCLDSKRSGKEEEKPQKVLEKVQREGQ